MCGSTAEEHTCTCCHGEGRRARGRRAYARKTGKSEPEVRTYRRQHRPLTPGPGVTIADGTVVAVSADPRWHEAQAGIAALGPEVRTARGEVIWVNVPSGQRWMRQYEHRPEPQTVRLPPGVVRADGTVDEAAVSDWAPEKVQKLHALIRSSFRGDEE